MSVFAARALLALTLVLAACGNGSKGTTGGTDPAGAAVSASAQPASVPVTVAPATSDEPSAVADPGDVPGYQDEEKRAAKDIDAKNYKHALEQLERSK